MDFVNPVIEKKDLPRVDMVSFTLLEKSYGLLLKLESIFTVLVLGLVFGIGVLFFDMLREYPLYLFFIIVYFLLAGFIIWVGFRSWQYKGYAIREHDILYKTGIFFKSTTIISFNRVQHIEIHQGPLDRMCKVVSITLFTAGGNSSDLSIPGLNPEDAARIKEWIMKKTTTDGEEE